MNELIDDDILLNDTDIFLLGHHNLNLPNLPNQPEPGQCTAATQRRNLPALDAACVTASQLEQFERMLNEPDYTGNKKLLTASQRSDIVQICKDNSYRPHWYDKDDPNSRQKLANLKSEVKLKYALGEKEELQRFVKLSDGDITNPWRRAGTTYEAGDFIVEAHRATGHASEDKTYAELCKRVYGISRSSVRILLKECITCNKNSANRSKAPPSCRRQPQRKVHDPNPVPVSATIPTYIPSRKDGKHMRVFKNPKTTHPIGPGCTLCISEQIPYLEGSHGKCARCAAGGISTANCRFSDGVGNGTGGAPSS